MAQFNHDVRIKIMCLLTSRVISSKNNSMLEARFIALQRLRDELISAESALGEICSIYGIDISYFYDNPNKLPSGFVDESYDKITRLHSVLGQLFKLKYEDTEKIVHLADFR